MNPDVIFGERQPNIPLLSSSLQARHSANSSNGSPLTTAVQHHAVAIVCVPRQPGADHVRGGSSLGQSRLIDGGWKLNGRVWRDSCLSRTRRTIGKLSARSTSHNLYAYVGNAPLDKTDSNGEFAFILVPTLACMVDLLCIDLPVDLRPIRDLRGNPQVVPTGPEFFSRCRATSASLPVANSVSARSALASGDFSIRLRA